MSSQRARAGLLLVSCKELAKTALQSAKTRRTKMVCSSLLTSTTESTSSVSSMATARTVRTALLGDFVLLRDALCFIIKPSTDRVVGLVQGPPSPSGVRRTCLNTSHRSHPPQNYPCTSSHTGAPCISRVSLLRLALVAHSKHSQPHSDVRNHDGQALAAGREGELLNRITDTYRQADADLVSTHIP
jgi:hypothetical protein